MISHTGISTKNYKKAKEFYVKALAPLGYKLGHDMPQYKAAGLVAGGKMDFWIMQQVRGRGNHIGFVAKNKKAVDAFYDAALKAGGKDNGAPGYRKEYKPGYYAAFVFDADKNNIEAVWMDSKPKK